MKAFVTFESVCGKVVLCTHYSVARPVDCGRVGLHESKRHGHIPVPVTPKEQLGSFSLTSKLFIFDMGSHVAQAALERAV